MPRSLGDGFIPAIVRSVFDISTWSSTGPPRVMYRASTYMAFAGMDCNVDAQGRWCLTLWFRAAAIKMNVSLPLGHSLAKL